MKKLHIHLVQMLYSFWFIVVAGGCAWGATPTPLPTPTPVPPPPGKIVFVVTQDRNRDIYLMNTDGSNRASLTQHSAEDFDPAWSPNGQHIVFVSNRYGRNQLVVMDMQTHQIHPLKNNVDVAVKQENLSTDYSPTWSPDGEWIAYTSSTPRGETNIFKIRLDGTEETQLTNHIAPDIQPAWSPDGSKIAFVSWRVDKVGASYLDPDETNLFIMNTDGSNVRRLTDDRETENIYPRWSPDGQWIAYASIHDRTPMTTTLFVYNPFTLEKKQVLRTVYTDIVPDWSPDGDWLVLNGHLDRFDSYTHICFVQVTGQNYQCLNFHSGHNGSAKWQPYIRYR